MFWEICTSNPDEDEIYIFLIIHLSLTDVLKRMKFYMRKDSCVGSSGERAGRIKERMIFNYKTIAHASPAPAEGTCEVESSWEPTPLRGCGT